ncbi:MAG: hypothetical protein K8T91_17180 [Planctomycetes bacterium]|nr:hypothetical protein [Planctomycetota bacterium]
MTATKIDEFGEIGQTDVMPRPTRYVPGGMVFHVLNRGVGRRNLLDYQVVRYVERNALRANLVAQAEDWRWSSLGSMTHQDSLQRLISDWPMPRPAMWLNHVNAPQTGAELAALRRCVNRGTPYGSETWVEATCERLHLDSTLRPRGRPRQQEF